MTLQRIIIIGTTGTGKTTLGKNLSAKLGMSAIDLDDLHWLPDWQARDVDSFRALVVEATANPAWVVSGNYSRVQDIFTPLADTMIWLDYSFPLVFKQLIQRSIRRILNGEACCNGNYETWGKFLSKESIIVWLFKSFRKRKRTAGEIFAHPENYKGVTLIRFRKPQETAAWLRSL